MKKIKSTNNFQESNEWVSASATQNYVLNNPLIDWLDLYGKENGFVKDQIDKRIDFQVAFSEQEKKFESAVLQHLETLAKVIKIGSPNTKKDENSVIQATRAALQEGAEIIFQGLLDDPDSKTYGSPDFLFRSDVLARIFPSTISKREANYAAPGLPKSKWHYLVVNTKFITLEVRSDGTLSHSQNFKALKVQAFISNQALGKIQGYTPSSAFLLGRGWKRRSSRKELSSFNAMDKLGRIIIDQETDEGKELAALASDATSWIRRLCKDGEMWSVQPTPSTEELRVNAKASQHYWSKAVKKILEQTEDLTTLFRVSAKNRSLANSRGIERWSDPLVNAENVGISGDVQVPRFNALLDINRDQSVKSVHPEQILANRSMWHEEPKLEFYVDFEIINTLNLNFSTFPNVIGNELIFMIGCGHLENGNWQFKSFIADRLTETAEGNMIDRWFRHMNKTYERIKPEENPQIIHWSSAEVNWLDTGANSARKRHLGYSWPQLKWFDFLELVIKAEPVAIRGSHNFGLKSVTKALNNLHLINLDWPEGPTDGLGAMVAAWSCEQEAQKKQCNLADLKLMEEIKTYNEVDCLAMKEIIFYLRKNH